MDWGSPSPLIQLSYFILFLEDVVMIQTTTVDQHMHVIALGLSTCTSITAETQDKNKKVVVGIKDQE